jgi:hypothetical protein
VAEDMVQWLATGSIKSQEISHSGEYISTGIQDHTK